MIEIDFAAFALDAVGDGAKRSTKAQADQHPADEEKSDVHVSAFPDVVSAAAEDRAATGAGRGWRGGADDGSEGAGLEQNLGAGEVGEDRLRHAARPFGATVGAYACIKARAFWAVSGHTLRPARSWRTK